MKQAEEQAGRQHTVMTQERNRSASVQATLMHISDLHASRYFQHHIAEQLAQQAHALQPDLLVISGDFVQRADFPEQWHAITAYLKTLPQPQLVVPGNHDVPLFQMFDRLMAPLKLYRRYISDNLNPTFRLPGLLVVGGCTAHGLTISGGYLSAEQLATMEQTFQQAPPGTCKVAVMHHQVIEPPGAHGDIRIANDRNVVRMFERCSVDLMLCGHVHVPHVGNTRGLFPDIRRGTIVCQSGTSTSSRLRGGRSPNSFQLIQIHLHAIEIMTYGYRTTTARFEPVQEYILPRVETPIDPVADLYDQPGQSVNMQ
ncbi:MAG: metallophosphoesterase [Chloroflexaceae bacterium]|nr:metallophosphoesterase [Chloroflexaceae bacterium]